MSDSPIDRYVLQAIAAQQAGDLGVAERLYRQVLAQASQTTVARFNLGCLLLGQGQVVEAAHLIAQALADDPANPLRASTVYSLSLALFAHGHWEVARPWLEEARLSHHNDVALDNAWQRCRAPTWLAPEVYDESLRTTLRRGAPREAGTYVYSVDIVGTCNLRCPTCPVGNLPDSTRPKGFMRLALFRDIVAKIRRESPVENPEIWLFNWGEPLLHPELPVFIGELKQHNLNAHLYTNLNIRQGLEAVIAAAPASIKVSISGFSDSTYAKTHKRGELALVRENLHAIRRWLDQYGVATRIWAGQHVYRSNQHEVAILKELCRELGFEHHPIAAFFQPLEKLLRIAAGEILNEPILDDLLEHPASYLKRFANQRDRRYDCELRANQTVINHDGSVALCCNIYEPENQLGVNFSDTPREKIEQQKYRHPLCARCQKAGLAYAPVRFDKLIAN